MSKKVERPVTTVIESRTYRRPILIGALLAAMGGLGGCSSVPDAVNPTQWYKSTVDFFAGEDGEGQVTEEGQVQSAEATAVPGADKPFPNLASVPQRSSVPVQRGLVADTKNRKYAEPIARQGEAAQMIAAQPPAPAPQPTPEPIVTPVVAPIQPAPAAAPATAVAQVAPAAAPAPAPAAPLNFSAITPKKIVLTPPPSAQTLPANAMSIGEESYGTIVVSSNGIVMNNGAASSTPSVSQQRPKPKFSFAAAPEVTTTMAKPLLPRSQSAIAGTKIATILFNNGSSGLSTHDRRILQEVVALHRQHGGTVKIVGHASSRTRDLDPVKHKMINYRLSVKRADRIAAQLRRFGMDPGLMLVDARSDSMPLYYETMPSGEAGNRRAEIYFQN